MRTRLSVAVAAFILHAMQGPWPGAIGHTIKYLKAQGGVEIALQVLVLIPEEFTSITFTAQSKVNDVKNPFFYKIFVSFTEDLYCLVVFVVVTIIFLVTLQNLLTFSYSE